MARVDIHEHWSQLSSLVDALLDATPERRAAIVADLIAADPSRRRELERILADCEREPPLLARPAAELFASLLEHDTGSFPDVLSDRYRLTREVGRGGMATVYLARDLRHARDVAVKVVHPGLASALGGERFLREIEIVAQLHHPHVVPLFDSGNADGALYYVMPFETGASLRARLGSEGALPLDDAIVILRDICDALAHAHDHGIVHRDIKPDNVMLSGRHALVTDFGVAKALAATVEPLYVEADSAGTPTASAIATVGSVLGTPAYMAPEQIAGDSRIDHRADIYSVGVLAYEVLAGRRPFTGESRKDMLAAQLTELPVPLATRRPDVPAELAELVMTCLAKRPADRWQSASEMVRRLERLSVATRERAGLSSRVRWMVIGAATAATVAVAALAVWRPVPNPNESLRTRWANARVERLTDFAGSEVDAAISPDGRFVAFLADRDSVFDAFVTRVGSGEFLNLTRGTLSELFNDDVRNVGFSGDGDRVWVRVADIESPASISTVPAAGGRLQPFLPTAVTAAWSPDESKVAYHEATPGDPIYVADRTGGNPRRIFIADAGVHNHHLSWSPDGRFLYFTHGEPPNEMDIWRIPADSGPVERLTMHSSKVAYPVPVDDQTLLYTATAGDGSGPWLYSMDVTRRRSQRVGTTVENYVSIAAGADVPGQPRQLVATVSNPAVELWAVPIASRIAREQDASRIALPTARSAAPRFAPDGAVLYLASRGAADAVWKLGGGGATELWKASDGAVAGAVALSPDGSRLCVPVRRQARSTVMCMNADGTGAQALGASLDVRGAPSWSPDGKWLAVGAREGAGVRVFKVPLDGAPPVRLVDSASSNPVWSPDGRFIVYSGTPRGRSVPLRAISPDGRPHALPAMSVDRVGDSYRFLPGVPHTLVVKLGGFRRQDFWSIDLTTGQRRQLTALEPGESLYRFDVAPDGQRIVFERVRENSDVVMIALPPR